MANVFIEENCTIEHEGKQFTSGGAWLCDCSDGKRRGVVYVNPPMNGQYKSCGGAMIACASRGWGNVTTWHGKLIAKAYFGERYQGTYCRMQSVSFELNGVKYSGRYCPDTSGACRVTSTRPISH